MTSGTPKYANTLSFKEVATVLAVASGTSIASDHLVKWSVRTSIHELLQVVSCKGTSKSTMRFCHARPTYRCCFCPDVLVFTVLLFWQIVHPVMWRQTSAVIIRVNIMLKPRCAYWCFSLIISRLRLLGQTVSCRLHPFTSSITTRVPSASPTNLLVVLLACLHVSSATMLFFCIAWYTGLISGLSSCKPAILDWVLNTRQNFNSVDSASGTTAVSW